MASSAEKLEDKLDEMGKCSICMVGERSGNLAFCPKCNNDRFCEECTLALVDVKDICKCKLNANAAQKIDILQVLKKVEELDKIVAYLGLVVNRKDMPEHLQREMSDVLKDMCEIINSC